MRLLWCQQLVSERGHERWSENVPDDLGQQHWLHKALDEIGVDWGAPSDAGDFLRVREAPYSCGK